MRLGKHALTKLPSVLKTLVGMFATGNGRNSTAPAYFSDFEYVPVEGVF